MVTFIIGEATTTYSYDMLLQQSFGKNVEYTYFVFIRFYCMLKLLEDLNDYWRISQGPREIDSTFRFPRNAQPSTGTHDPQAAHRGEPR